MIEIRRRQFNAWVGWLVEGHQRIKFMDSLIEYASGGHSVAEMVRISHDRKKWRSMIASATRHAISKIR